MTVTAGQAHESTALVDLLEGVDLVDEEGEPIVHPIKLAGDKAYRAGWIDRWLRERDIEPVIPSKRGEPFDPTFDREAYRGRNVIERLIGWLKESRRVLTRSEKLARNYLAMVKWACIKRYLRLMGV